MLLDIADTLKERRGRYGSLDTHSLITQILKGSMREFKDGVPWNSLEDDQKEALEMIVHKIGRILNGDPKYADSWIDIAGYAKLVADRLDAEEVEALR